MTDTGKQYARHRVSLSRWLWIMVAAMLSLQYAQAAEVTATLDRDRIVLGETVTLLLQTDDPSQSLDGDLSVLDLDFLLIDRRTETQMSIVNGQRSAQVKLNLVLEPKRIGRLTIPSLPIGDGGTRPLQVHVEAAPLPKPGDMPPVFIEVEIEPVDVPAYVHAQMSFTTRVFYQQNLTEATISQPEPTNAAVRLLDEIPYQAQRNGTRYRVLERHYAIFPERSGEMTIPPLKLSGRLVERRGDRLWQPNVRGRRIEVESDEMVIDVQPKPSSFTADSWQPARNLELMQQISAADALTVGEPVTRTVIVDALGLEENMITEPIWPEMDNARIYPDQPQGISRDDGQWVLGHKEFRYAVVPEQEGQLVLPELKVEWWDTVNNEPRMAVLPEKVLNVLPSATSALVSQHSEAAGITPPVAGPGATIMQNVTGGYWRWLTLVFALLWALTLLWAWRLRSQGIPGSRTEQPVASENEAALLSQLKRAAERGDRTMVRKALTEWIDLYGPTGADGSLLTFASGLENQELATRIRALDSAGFRQGSAASWDNNGFWRDFSRWYDAWRNAPASQPAPVTDLYAPENRRAG